MFLDSFVGHGHSETELSYIQAKYNCVSLWRRNVHPKVSTLCVCVFVPESTGFISTRSIQFLIS
jgi:hypothetical protein